MQLKKEVDVVLMIVFVVLFFIMGSYIGFKENNGEKVLKMTSEWSISPGAKDVNPVSQRKNVFEDNKYEEEIVPKEPIEEMPVKVEEDFKIIEIKDTKFNPSELNITVGTTVFWVNQDSKRVYQVYEKSSDQLFNSLQIRPFESLNYTFDEPGEYRFGDAIFTFMKGVIRVE